ncbi:MAG TPA: hypothetical protein VFP72_12305 [Kineosporiaceae bacterium]|nr:hypothetical protein [Kineosporiaceae bacterium]
MTRLALQVKAIAGGKSGSQKPPRKDEEDPLKAAGQPNDGTAPDGVEQVDLLSGTEPAGQLPEAEPKQEPGPDAEPDPEQDDQQQVGQDSVEQAERDATLEWAGDRYEEGDETDPQGAFAAFTGQGGEEAWLDRADDGTLTGWVRDADGSVFRYADPHAWCIDVDDSGMTMTHGPQLPAGGEPAPSDPGRQQAPTAQPGAEPGLFDGMEGKARNGGRPLRVIAVRHRR